MEMVHTHNDPGVHIVFIVVLGHTGGLVLLCPPTLPHILFLIGDACDLLLVSRDVLPDILLLDVRLSEAIKCALTHALGQHYQHARLVPLIANVYLQSWQEANRETEHLRKSEIPAWNWEYLLATATLKRSAFPA